MGDEGEVVECTPIPGKHLCHKPMAPVCCHDTTDPQYPQLPDCSRGIFWTDSVDQIAAQFGIDPRVLCEYNNMTNCNALSFRCSALAIPIH
jgi:hypothetical protein